MAYNAPPPVKQVSGDLSGVQIIALGSYNVTTLTSDQPAQVIDFASPTLQGQLQALGSVYVDNWTNDAIVYVIAPGTSQVVLVPPFSVGWYPLAVPVIAKLSVFMVPTRTTITSVPVSLCVSSAVLAQGPIFNQNYIDGPPLTNVPVIGYAVGNTDLVPAVAGQVVRLWRGRLTSAGTIRVLDGATPVMGFGAFMPLNFEFNERPYFTSTPGQTLALECSAVTNGYVQITQGP